MTATNSTSICQTAREIIGALLYFEIFSYPLTGQEVFHFSNCPEKSAGEILEKLEDLVADGVVFQIENFYLTKNQPDWVEKRKENNCRADELLPIAFQKAKLIGRFPFVRAVMVSGSLSKHCMTPDSDIDFFIVTAPGRLWLARILLTVYKKIFLLNSHKYFCINYFVDTEHLEIEEKNLFTATEIVTLLPVLDGDFYEKLYAINQSWTMNFYPNFPKRTTENVPPCDHSFFKKSLEWLLSGWLGRVFDHFAMKITVGFWKKKFSHFDDETFGVALKSRRHVSKHHPLYFQQKVLRAMEEKWREFGNLGA